MYVDPGLIPAGTDRYVCWVDIMGTKSKMEKSVKTSGVSILKLHGSVIEMIKRHFTDASTSRIRAYPMMDGAYIISETWDDLIELLKLTFIESARDYLMEDQYTDIDPQDAEDKRNSQRAFIRASVAYGKVIEGNTIPREACIPVGNSVNHNFFMQDMRAGDSYRYKDSILLGYPMVKAYSGEQKAPPFGIFIDESARPVNTPYSWWKWFETTYAGDGRRDTDWNTQYKVKFIKAIKSYFKYAERHAYEIDYKIDRIKEHKRMFSEYFSCFDD